MPSSCVTPVGPSIYYTERCSLTSRINGMTKTLFGEQRHLYSWEYYIIQGVRTWGPIDPPVLSCGKCSGCDWWWYRECEREEPLPRGTRLSTEGKPWTGRWYSVEICTWWSSCGQIVRDKMVGVISRGWCMRLCDAGGCRFVRTTSKIAWPRTCTNIILLYFLLLQLIWV